MMSNLLKIGFIGGGKMAQAMAKGFISAGQSHTHVKAFFKNSLRSGQGWDDDFQLPSLRRGISEGL
jgi:3-hydroxyisobutyrate dehydrogenase-like beta-hydroxyacid dehydrogenase